MAHAKLDVFGCEAEVACLSSAALDLRRAGTDDATVAEQIRGLAIDGPVTGESARRIGALLARYGIGSAPLQAFGRLLG
jgi:hypothetical protein